MSRYLLLLSGYICDVFDMVRNELNVSFSRRSDENGSEVDLRVRIKIR